MRHLEQVLQAKRLLDRPDGGEMTTTVGALGNHAAG